jgi:release factor glutamine methyltransferase
MDEVLTLRLPAAGGDARSLRQWTDEGAAVLAAAGVPTARLDAEVLLAEALGCDRTAIHARPDSRLSPEQAGAFLRSVERRAAREPLAYIIGRKEFWSLEFEVTPAVLIPRPETEVAVEVALELLRANNAQGASVCDLGAGSGCIAIALARELPHATVVAADLSPAALAVAGRNAAKLGVRERVELVASNLLAGLRGRRFDLIVSNPPYVAAEEIGALEPELRWEPELALNGGVAGLEIIRWLFAEASEALRSGGWLVMEIGADQAAVARRMAVVNGFANVRVDPDYSGSPRVLVAQAG